MHQVVPLKVGRSLLLDPMQHFLMPPAVDILQSNVPLFSKSPPFTFLPYFGLLSVSYISAQPAGARPSNANTDVLPQPNSQRVIAVDQTADLQAAPDTQPDSDQPATLNGDLNAEISQRDQPGLSQQDLQEEELPLNPSATQKSTGEAAFGQI